MSSIQNYLRKFNQRRLEVDKWRCDYHAFNLDSAVGVRCPESETKTNDRQRHYTGCILSSVQGTTCLKLEIVRIHLIGEFEEFARNNNNFENLSASSNVYKY
jgi:hypothetical protein